MFGLWCAMRFCHCEKCAIAQKKVLLAQERQKTHQDISVLLKGIFFSFQYAGVCQFWLLKYKSTCYFWWPFNPAYTALRVHVSRPEAALEREMTFSYFILNGKWSVLLRQIFFCDSVMCVLVKDTLSRHGSLQFLAFGDLVGLVLVGSVVQWEQMRLYIVGQIRSTYYN